MVWGLPPISFESSKGHWITRFPIERASSKVYTKTLPIKPYMLRMGNLHNTVPWGLEGGLSTLEAWLFHLWTILNKMAI